MASHAMLKEMANLVVSALFHQTVEALPLAPGPCRVSLLDFENIRCLLPQFSL